MEHAVLQCCDSEMTFRAVGNMKECNKISIQSSRENNKFSRMNFQAKIQERLSILGVFFVALIFLKIKVTRSLWIAWILVERFQRLINQA